MEQLRKCCMDRNNPKHSVFALIHNVHFKNFYCLRSSSSFCQVSPENWPSSLYTDINLFRQNTLEVCNVLNLDSMLLRNKLPVVNPLQVYMIYTTYWTLAGLHNCGQWSSHPKQNWFSAMLVQMANNFKTRLYQQNLNSANKNNNIKGKVLLKRDVGSHNWQSI